MHFGSLADLNGQALAWCNKLNSKVHATNEIPFERLKKEGLNSLSREYIIDKITLHRVQKDCLIPHAGNPYFVPAEYVGKDVAVVALDSMLAAYYMSGFPIKKTLDDFDFSFQPSIDKRQINELATCASWRTARMWWFSARPAWARPTWPPPSAL